MQRVLGLAAAAALLLLYTATASAQSHTFDFEDGTDQGFGTGFGADASAAFPIESVAGSLRMKVLDTADFQQAGNETGNAASTYYQAMAAAAINESLYRLSYDWYVDTSVNPGGGTPGTNWGSFLQLGTYVNTGSGYYAQDFPGPGKDVELNGAQLDSGQVFSGTVSETFAAKGFNIPLGETFFRVGLISNGDGTNATVYFDNISISPVPEPATIGLIGAGLLGLAMIRRRK